MTDNNAPFIFGRLASGMNFTDRENETARLVTNFQFLINTILISPRRWGKSSLVAKAAECAMKKDKMLKVCLIDIFNVRTEEQFYRQLAQGIIKATASKWQEAAENAKKFFSLLVPKIILGSTPGSELSLDFDWKEVERNPDEILDLAENIAQSKGMKIVICIDEFQNIANFENPLAFQRQLRAHWQRHQNVSYCLYGSKRHMMTDIFTDPEKPFYKFGDIMFLSKIDTLSFVRFIKKRFSDTGKKIGEEEAKMIVALADNHPYYVQQLAQMSWLRTDDKCSLEIIKEAHSSLVGQLTLVFLTITQTLTTQQLNYLHALLAGETAITSTETMSQYNISSPTSAMRSKNALINMEILDAMPSSIALQDPIYAYWLKTEYFKISPA